MAQNEHLIEPNHAGRSGSASKALGVLAAVSAGGLMAMRMKPASFMFLAGATAVALLSRKRIIPAARPLELMPERPPEPVALPRMEVDAWLAKQIERERQAPIITLDAEPLPETLPPAPEPLDTARAAMEDATVPAAENAFPNVSIPAGPTPLAEVPMELPAIPPASIWPEPLDSPAPPFFSLAASTQATRQATREIETAVAGFVPLSSPAPETPDGPSASSPETPLPFLNLPPSHGDFNPPSPAGTPNASWLLGIEPLPSWDELSAEPPLISKSPYADFAFLSEPPGAASYSEQPAPPPVAPPIQPLFVPGLFQGSELPDEITVTDEPTIAQLVEPAQKPVSPRPQETVATETPVVTPFSSPPSPTEGQAPPCGQPPEESPASLWPGIDPSTRVPVYLSPQGASFNEPLAVLQENPSTLPGGIPPPPPLRPLAPVVEAEIVVRPRGLSPTRIQPRQAANAPAEGDAPSEAAPVPIVEPPAISGSQPEIRAVPQNQSPASTAPPPAPAILPREQKARKTWRSWWRGD